MSSASHCSWQCNFDEADQAWHDENERGQYEPHEFLKAKAVVGTFKEQKVHLFNQSITIASDLNTL